MSCLRHLRMLISSAFIVSTLSQTTPQIGYIFSKFEYTSVVSSEQLQELIKSPQVTLVYYYKRDIASVRYFFEEYETSAKYLQAYNANLVVFDCTADKTGEENCKVENVDNDIYSYQNGQLLLILELDTMFDVDSIMANTLQLVLLQDVPVVSSRLERQDLQKSYVGKYDIIFGYFVEFGTKEHRIFMEIAYTFFDHYKFVMTTELQNCERLKGSDMISRGQSVAMWMLLCTESTSEEVAMKGDCRNFEYKGEISLAALATFVKVLSEQMIFHAPKDGISNLFSEKQTVPTIFIYTNMDASERTDSILVFMSFELRGLVKVVVVDMDNQECRTEAEKQGFKGKLPTIAVRKMDDVVIFLEEDKELNEDSVSEFLVKHIYPDKRLLDASSIRVVYSADVEAKQRNLSSHDIEMSQDDQVAEAVLRLMSKEMALDLVPDHSKTTFYSAVKLADLLMVLFYLPFDRVSMAFLRDFGHASQILANNYSDKNVLARVNCYDATDLCEAENITAYPLLRIYQKNMDTQDYQGPLHSPSVVNAVKLLQLKSPTELQNMEEVERFMKGEHPLRFHQFTPSSVLLLSSQMLSDVEKLYIDTAKCLSTISAFAIVRDDVAKSVAKKYGVPQMSVMAYHRSDPHKPVRALSHDISAPFLADFVRNSIITAIPELTMMNFPTLFAKKKPFAILFLNPTDQVSKTAMKMFTQAALLEQFDNTAVFCWMNAQAKSVGLKILSEYTWTATLPMVTVVDHREGQVFNYQAEELKLKEVSEWLTRTLAGKERPSKILQKGKWEPPGPHYDFLNIIAQEKAKEVEEDFDFIRIETETGRLPNQRKSDALQEERLKTDSEIRETLIGLRRSRLKNYWHDSKQLNEKPEVIHSHPNKHTEL